ncbi:MAG: DUF4738 domain-containing protein [Mucilaginibacter sp.]
MTRTLIILTCFSLLVSCSTPHPAKKTASVTKKADSPQKAIAIDTSVSYDTGPTFELVKSELLSQYDKVEHIDTTLFVGNDSLHVHEKYYCLKDNAVVVPKKYLWGGDKTKDFVTHSFVSAIVIVKNKDTILNKVFRKSDFDPVINTEERKYAIIFSASFLGYRKRYDSIIFGYSISIPLTDVGVPAYIAINKKGEFKMLDEYAKVGEN